ncbi:MAG: TIGR04086 family membrane protein [Clostridia bacterium]|nr:TIGR04086 family membrane protein [Clostridia bacterium]
MTTTGTARRSVPGKPSRPRRTGVPLWLRLLKGLGAALLVTIAGVAVFALLMQWIRPTETAVRIFNQVLKLVSIGAGVYVAVGRGQEGGLLKGAAVGALYMALGVAVYAMLSGQDAPATAYLADLGMGVAGGGIVGMLLSNISPK